MSLLAEAARRGHVEAQQIFADPKRFKKASSWVADPKFWSFRFFRGFRNYFGVQEGPGGSGDVLLSIFHPGISIFHQKIDF